MVIYFYYSFYYCFYYYFYRRWVFLGFAGFLFYPLGYL